MSGGTSQAPELSEVSHDEIERIVDGTHHDPHSVLGAHHSEAGTVVRALRPLADSVAVVLPDGRRFPMTHVHQGVFEVRLPVSEIPDYRIAVAYPASTEDEALPETITDDPYRHLPTLGEVDLHLIGEGRHEQLWRVLGAHASEQADGTAFAVWAPDARGVRVIGDFNHWDGRAHPMRSLGASGVWELYVPGVVSGARYKYAIRGPDGSWHI